MKSHVCKNPNAKKDVRKGPSIAKVIGNNPKGREMEKARYKESEWGRQRKGTRKGRCWALSGYRLGGLGEKR